MALEKAVIPIPLAGGLDTKTDPFQVAPGKLALLENAKFETAKKLRKVPGDSPLSQNIIGSTAKISNAVQLSSFNQELVLNSGTNLYSYSADEIAWSDKGLTFNLSLSTSPVIRDNYAQTCQDSATHPTGVQIFAWEDSQGGVRYSVIDMTTKLQIVSNQPLLSTGVTPRCAAIGNFLLIFVYDTNTAGLYYYPITIVNPSVLGTRVEIASDVSASNPNFDIVVINTKVFVVYNNDSGGISVLSVDQYLDLSATRVVAGESASVTITTFGDALNNLWVSYYNGTAVKYFIFAYSLPTSPLLGPTIVETVANVRNITGAVQGTAPVTFSSVFASGVTQIVVNNTAGLIIGQTIIDLTTSGHISFNTTITAINGNVVTLSRPTAGASASSPGDSLQTTLVSTIFYEISAAITYNHFIRSNMATIAGVVGTPITVIRSVGLGGKAFVYGTNIFVMATYQGPLQPTYFLINQNGIVALKLAPLEGGGLTTKSVLPQINLVSPGQYQISYLQQDFFATTEGGNFFLTGVMQGVINLNPKNIMSVSIGNGLQITGGFLSMYDGISAVELGYHLFPEQPTVVTAGTGGALSPGQYQWTTVYAWPDNFGQIHRSAPSIPVTEILSGGTAISAGSVFASGATQITMSSMPGFMVGQVITDVTTPGNILAGTIITAITGSTLTLSNPTQGSSAGGGGDTIMTVDTYAATVTAVTLRVTAKKPPIRSNAWIELYRTEANQTIFYLISSIQNPTYNDTTVDTETFVDITADQDILGNLQLYTTGGVIENISPPAPKLIWQYKNRLILVPFEADNTWWYSQEVIPGTPLEFNDSFVNNMDQRDGPITAGAQMDDKNIFFKGPANIFYVAGDGPDQTGANNDFTQPQRIATGSGCINPNSVLLMPNGLFYQSMKGIYLLDRSLNAQYAGAEVEAFNSANVTSAQVIENDNELRFTLDSGVQLMFDYTFQQWTTIPNVNAVATALFQNEFCYVQPNGLVLQENPNIWTHNGNFRRIKMTTSWLSMAGLQGYQRVYRMLVLGNFISPHMLKCNLAINFNPNYVQEDYINPANVIDYGVYGGPQVQSFTSIFAAGDSTMVVSNAVGLAVGQSLRDATTQGNILGGTTITNIIGNTITLSNPTQGASAASPGDTVQASIAYGNPAGIPYGGRFPPYQWRIRMKYQKCETIQLTLEEIPLFPYGEGLSLSAISMEIGSKHGAMKLPASQSVG